MIRKQNNPRQNWQHLIKEEGLIFGDDKAVYWGEGSYYEFTEQQILHIESATYELHDMVLKATQSIIDNGQFEKVGVPNKWGDLISESWNNDWPYVYSRFDFAWTSNGIKLLEANYNTPTSLLEASVIQWTWLEAMRESNKNVDQFNSLHEKLIARWKELDLNSMIHFGHMDDSIEDQITTAYLADTALQAGYNTKGIIMDDIGWNGKYFTDLSEQEINNIFALYPWEWIINDEFAEHIFKLKDSLKWIEPPWKMIASSKGLLAVLWEMFPNHNLLLPAFTEGNYSNGWVSKPFFSREGNNINIIGEEKTEGPYSECPVVYQQYVNIKPQDGYYPIIGSWVIGNDAAGIGIRESKSRITDDFAKFVPHLFK